MTQPEAKAWIKQNWTRLANSGQLGEAVTRYLAMGTPIIESPSSDDTSIDLPSIEKTAAIEVSVSPANDKKIADFFGSPLD